MPNLDTELVLRAGHLPSCGDGAEFPWDCTCDYRGFMERMRKVLSGWNDAKRWYRAFETVTGSEARTPAGQRAIFDLFAKAYREDTDAR